MPLCHFNSQNSFRKEVKKMVQEKMTVTQALTELKTLDAKIQKAINNCDFISVYSPKKSAQTEEAMAGAITSTYQSMTAMINRRNAIKRAVTISNANTTVTITCGGESETMTVAEAIDMKAHGVTYKEEILQRIASRLTLARRDYQDVAEAVNKVASNLAAQIAGQSAANGGTNTDLYNEAYNSYIESNAPKIVDPLGLDKMVPALSDWINEFNTKIDTALAVSNASTIIEVEYNG